tara:strand:- start:81 stop:221 length:141 start_codon:yes stop_codon:yes gene_type:complete
MKVEEAIKVLTKYNEWRRDDTGEKPMPQPSQIGIAIDVAIQELKNQ